MMKKTDGYRSTRDGWRRIWDAEADIASELKTVAYPRTRQPRALYTPYLPRDELVLEAGCGLGIEVMTLDGQGYKAVGIDYAENAVRRIQAYQPGHRLTIGDIHSLPYRNGAFGSCLSLGVLEHFEFGPVPGLREANRVLRPGGVLVLMIPYPNLVWRLVRLKRRWSGRPPATPEFYETTYTDRQLEGHLAGTGFNIVERHPIGHSFTFWGLGRLFRGAGYYETSALAEWLGGLCRSVLPWSMCFESLIIARKARDL
jgi:SAM-dependent methyltransferase